MEDGSWATNLKTGQFPRKIKRVLKKLGYPDYIWRETILYEIYPEGVHMRKRREYPKDIKGKEYRKMITTCMSDPSVLGYVRDGGNTRNPRFKKGS